MKIYRDKTTILETLVSKKGIVKAILDTDTYNEIDDQFALVQMLFSKKKNGCFEYKRSTIFYE